MKKILAVCMCFVASACLGQVPPKSKAIKIDYMTMGKDAPDSLYVKETCLDSKMKIVKFPTGPKFKDVRDSIPVSFHFKFYSKKDTCFVQVTTLLEILDKDLNVVAQKTVYVSQFDRAVQYYIFFKDRSFDSGDYFIQFKIATGNEDYVSTLAQLPSRFKP